MNRTVEGWKALAAIAAFIVGVLIGFAEAPPGDERAKGLAVFCVAVLVAIGYVAVRKWNRLKDLPGWCVAAVVGLIFTLTVHYFYTTLQDRYTATYQDTPQVIGDVLTDAGRSYQQRNPSKSNDDLLFDAAGKTTTIWTVDSIQKARRRLRYGFLMCAPLVGVTIVAAVQVADLAQKKRSARKR
jgi:4-amino-4-deoxy-L-arabinose transferase-like glycosyltransferase